MHPALADHAIACGGANDSYSYVYVLHIQSIGDIERL